MNQSGLHGLEWMTRDPYSLVDDSLVTRTQCIAVFSILADVVEVKTGSRPLVDPLYPADRMAEKQFYTVDYPS